MPHRKLESPLPSIRSLRSGEETLGDLFQRELIGPDREGDVRGDFLPVVQGSDGKFSFPRMPGAAQDLFRSVGRFAKGLRGESEVGISDVVNIAGAGLAGGLGRAAARRVPPNSVGLFGSGRLASQGQQVKAARMEQGGYSPKEINRATGMSRGAEGKWRVEIPDQAAFIKTKAGKVDKLGQLLVHPRLYTYYPDIPEIDIFVTNKKGVGGFYRMPWGNQPESLHVNKNMLKRPTELKSVLLHEIQHAIQQREAFGVGGGKTKAFTEAVAKAFIKRAEDSGDKALAKEYQKRLDSFRNLPEKEQQEQISIVYKRMAGEVESRNVEWRQGFTNERRRAESPEETESVPRNQQIVLTPQELGEAFAAKILGIE